MNEKPNKNQNLNENSIKENTVLSKKVKLTSEEVLKEREKARLAREKEKEREKQRLAKEREKEKARLAREKEKEKEKARLAREKEKEKEKLKARLAREKEKEKLKKDQELAKAKGITLDELYAQREKARLKRLEKINKAENVSLPIEEPQEETHKVMLNEEDSKINEVNQEGNEHRNDLDPKKFFEAKGPIQFKITDNAVIQEKPKSKGKEVIDNLQKLRKQIMSQKALEKELLEKEALNTQHQDRHLLDKLSELEQLVKMEEFDAVNIDVQNLEDHNNQLIADLNNLQNRLDVVLNIQYQGINILDSNHLTLSDDIINFISQEKEKELESTFASKEQTYQNEIKILQADLESLQEVQKINNELLLQKETLEKESQETIDSLRLQVEELNNLQENNVILTTQINDFKTIIAQKDEEIANLQKQLKIKNDAVFSMQKDYSSLEIKNQFLQAQINNINNEIMRYNQEQIKNEQTISQLKLQNQQLLMELNNKKQEIAFLNQELTKVPNDVSVSKLESQIRAISSMIADFQGKSKGKPYQAPLFQHVLGTSSQGEQLSMYDYNEDLEVRDNLLASLRAVKNEKPEPKVVDDYHDKISSLEKQVKELTSMIKSFVSLNNNQETKDEILKGLTSELENYKNELKAELEKQVLVKPNNEEVVSQTIDEKTDEEIEEKTDSQETFDVQDSHTDDTKETTNDSIVDEEEDEYYDQYENFEEIIDSSFGQKSYPSMMDSNYDQIYKNKFDNILRLQKAINMRKQEEIMKYQANKESLLEKINECQKRIDELNEQIKKLETDFKNNKNFSTESKNAFETERTKLYLAIQAREDSLLKLKEEDLRKLDLRYKNTCENFDMQLKSLDDEWENLETMYTLKTQKNISRINRENEILQKLAAEKAEEKPQVKSQIQDIEKIDDSKQPNDEVISAVINKIPEVSKSTLVVRKPAEEAYNHEINLQVSELSKSTLVVKKPNVGNVDQSVELKAIDNANHRIIESQEERRQRLLRESKQFETKDLNANEKSVHKENELKQFLIKYVNLEKQLSHEIADIANYKRLKKNISEFENLNVKQQETLKSLFNEITTNPNDVEIRNQYKDLKVRNDNLIAKIDYYQKQLNNCVSKRVVQGYIRIVDKIKEMKEILISYEKLRDNECK